MEKIVLEDWKEIICKICTRALTGNITIDEFYNTWPENLEKSELIDAIYSDLEERIQHFPAKLFSGKPDEKAWKASCMYKKILIDTEILNLSNSESELGKIRQGLIDDKNLLLDEIPRVIKKLTSLENTQMLNRI